MSIDAVIQKIIGDAQKEADSIVAQAAEQARRVEDGARKEANSTRDDMLARAKDEAGREEKKSRIAASLELRKAILEEKQSAISLVFDTALKNIQKLSKADYRSMVEKMLMRCEGNEEVIIPPGEKRIDEELIARVNKRLLKNGKKGNLGMSRESREIPGGGFVLKHGRVEKNSSFAVYLNLLRRRIEAKISDILFGPG